VFFISPFTTTAFAATKVFEAIAEKAVNEVALSICLRVIGIFFIGVKEWF